MEIAQQNCSASNPIDDEHGGGEGVGLSSFDSSSAEVSNGLVGGVVCNVLTTVLKFLNTSQAILTWMMRMAAMSPARLWALTRNKRQQALRQKLQQSSIWR